MTAKKTEEKQPEATYVFFVKAKDNIVTRSGRVLGQGAKLTEDDVSHLKPSFVEHLLAKGKLGLIDGGKDG